MGQLADMVIQYEKLNKKAWYDVYDLSVNCIEFNVV